MWLQWRRMSGIVLSKSWSSDLFCLVYNRSTAFLFTKSIPRISQRRSMQNTLLMWLLICCQYAWRHDMKTLSGLLAFLRRTHRSLDSPRNGPEIWSLKVSSVVSFQTPLNKEPSYQWFDMAHVRCHPYGLALYFHSYSPNQHKLCISWKIQSDHYSQIIDISQEFSLIYQTIQSIIFPSPPHPVALSRTRGIRSSVYRVLTNIDKRIKSFVTNIW